MTIHLHAIELQQPHKRCDMRVKARKYREMHDQLRCEIQEQKKAKGK